MTFPPISRKMKYVRNFSRRTRVSCWIISFRNNQTRQWIQEVFQESWLTSLSSQRLADTFLEWYNSQLCSYVGSVSSWLLSCNFLWHYRSHGTESTEQCVSSNAHNSSWELSLPSPFLPSLSLSTLCSSEFSVGYLPFQLTHFLFPLLERSRRI